MAIAAQPFERHIVYRLERAADGMLILTATLTDRFHDIAVEVRAHPQTLVVHSARADFLRYPCLDCPNAATGMQKLVGLIIGKGLNKALNKALGGITGCGNLRTLLAGLLPLALNARAAAGCQSEEEAQHLIHEQLVGTCAGYAKPPVPGP
ncbi:MAG: hypothetical protein BWY57_02056 [Betaproteobacteria bacterium ADurb.Bin341]|nr:MAG: hypothetical protein BWY57_02056 [Betaproteobacteria bacterium ADurb.Bin341]